MIDIDEGSYCFGEVVLVLYFSFILCLGLFFYNILYDENVVLYIVIGSVYCFNVKGGIDMDVEQFV